MDPAARVVPPGRVVQLFLKFPFEIRYALVLDHGAITTEVNFISQIGELSLEAFYLSINIPHYSLKRANV